MYHDFVLFAERESLLPEAEDAIGVSDLNSDISLRVIIIDTHPRSAGRESTMWGVLPLDRSASVVACFLLEVVEEVRHMNRLPTGDTFSGGLGLVPKVVRRDVLVLVKTPTLREVLHTDLFTLVDKQGSALRGLHYSKKLRG